MFVSVLGMHNIGFFDNILHFIWLMIDTNTDTDMCVFASSHLIAELTKSPLEWNLHTVLLWILLPCWPASKCRHKIQSMKLCDIHYLHKRGKILKFHYKYDMFYITYVTGCLIKETSAYYFTGYYTGGYWRVGRYPIFNFNTNIS